MRARRLTTALALVPLVLGAAAGAATADDVANKLDATVDAVAETMPLNVGGSAGTTQLYVTPTNGDGKNGCNLNRSTTLVATVTSSNPAVATVSPSSVTFDSCGDVPTLTVTPTGEGSADVTLTETSNDSEGSFDLRPAAFRVVVTAAAPANTAPGITVDGVEAGATYAKGAVPPATCVVVDAEDGGTSFPATLGAVTGPNASDGIGDQTASCSYTDRGGLVAAAAKTYSIVDPSAPAVGYVLDPASPDGESDWYTGSVSLTWEVAEPDSPGSLVRTGCDDVTVTSDQAATEYTCSAMSAGGTTQRSVTLKRDATAPAVAYDGVVSGTEGADGWYTSDVTVAFTATDALSGPASQTASVTSSGEGETVGVESPAFTDAAGNRTEAGAVTKTFKVDKTGPGEPTFTDGPASEVYFGTTVTAPTCRSSDDVSGATCAVALDPAADGTADDPNAVGTHTYTATATNGAGLTSTATLTYTVKAWRLAGFYAPVDMGGVWNTVKGGSTVPLKFEVFADQELTSTSVVKSFTQSRVACPGSGAVTDPVGVTTTGGTALRYDATGGQFVQNWQTPKDAGACYAVTLTTQDGSQARARFQLR